MFGLIQGGSWNPDSAADRASQIASTGRISVRVELDGGRLAGQPPNHPMCQGRPSKMCRSARMGEWGVLAHDQVIWSASIRAEGTRQPPRGPYERPKEAEVRNQLRDYRITPEAMTEFVSEWIRRVMPLRSQAGFAIVGAWSNPETNRFVWVVAHQRRFRGGGSLVLRVTRMESTVLGPGPGSSRRLSQSSLPQQSERQALEPGLTRRMADHAGRRAAARP